MGCAKHQPNSNWCLLQLGLSSLQGREGKRWAVSEVECLIQVCQPAMSSGETGCVSWETARNLYTRGREHHQNYLRKQQESFMLKHQNDQHGQREPNFEAKVIGCFKDCLTRQISEGVHIRRCEEEVLNSKAEWHQPALWKVRSELCRE